MTTTVLGDDGIPRCAWAAGAAEFGPYHDNEWGWPVADDDRLFEKLSLEAFQSGLSWRTILNKREGFRAAFDHFQIERVAAYDDHDVARLLGDARIVRHRGKIEAVINNARRASELIDAEGSLAAFVWSFEPDPASLPAPQTVSVSPESTALAKELKRRGLRFVGPTTVYAFLQAMGLVNDHTLDCSARDDVERARSAFVRPTG